MPAPVGRVKPYAQSLSAVLEAHVPQSSQAVPATGGDPIYAGACRRVQPPSTERVMHSSCTQLTVPAR
jgi:hypothetical protein